MNRAAFLRRMAFAALASGWVTRWLPEVQIEEHDTPGIASWAIVTTNRDGEVVRYVGSQEGLFLTDLDGVHTFSGWTFSARGER